MPEETQNIELQTELKVQPPVEQPKETQQKEPDDLLSRVTKFVTNNDPEQKSEDNIKSDPDKFNYNELESIQSPEEAKKWAESAYKSMQRGEGQKFQEIADLKKELQGALESGALKKNWSSNDIQELLRDPTFVQAAQHLEQGNNSSQTDDYSYLSDSEKQRITALEKANTDANRRLAEMQRSEEHTRLSTKYANYDSGAIDILSADLISGKAKGGPEEIYKVLNHDDNVRRAYEMGKRDERNGITERVELSSPSTSSVNTRVEAPILPEKEEKSKTYFARLAANALNQLSTPKR